jgi:hypothetical protein
MELVVVGLAAFRLWRLVAVDSLLAPFRAVLSDRLVSWLSCPWCAGFWVGLAVWAVWRFWRSEWVDASLFVLAVSAVVGLTGSYHGRESESGVDG